MHEFEEKKAHRKGVLLLLKGIYCPSFPGKYGSKHGRFALSYSPDLAPCFLIVVKYLDANSTLIAKSLKLMLSVSLH